MSNHVEPQTKTVVISWVEESRHQTVVRVPLDFDADERDLADGLAELSSDGFRGLERSQIEVADTPPRRTRRRSTSTRPATTIRATDATDERASAMSNARAKK